MTDVVYLNPAAGGGRVAESWSRIADRAIAQDVEVIRADDRERARSAIDAAIARRPRRIVAVGGDGTANLVAERILLAGAGRDIIFGLIPAGTGCDLASMLALPRAPAEALRIARNATPRPLDAIEIATEGNGRRFAVNIASIGVSGAVDQAANRIATRSRATYLLATVRGLLGYRPRPWRLTLDGAPLFEGTFFVAAFANGRSFGGGMRVAPDAVADDGLADVVIVPPVPLVTLPWRLPQFLRGHHVRLPFVHVARGTVLHAEPIEAQHQYPPFDLDGETLAASPATFTLHAHALQVAATPEAACV